MVYLDLQAESRFFSKTMISFGSRETEMKVV